MVVVLSESFKKYYYTTWISFPTWITIVTILFAILFPFFLQFKHSLFWYTINDKMEHPIVSYLDKYIISALGEENRSYLMTSFDNLNNLIENTMTGNLECKLQSASDENKVDSFNCTGKIDKTNINNFQAILFFNYSIYEYVKIHLQTACYVNINLNKAHDIKIKTDGFMRFKQEYPLIVKSEQNQLYIDLFNPTKYSQYFPSMEQILDNFVFNYTYGTYYDYEYYITKAPVEPSDPSENGGLEIEMNIRIPHNQLFIFYRTALESLKYNWIEYLAVFIPLSVLGYKFLSLIFSNKIFKCTIITDIPDKRL